MFGKLGSGVSNLVGGGSFGKIALYGCCGCALLAGGLIFIISFAFMSRGEPMDLQGGVYQTGEALRQGYGVSEEEIARDVEAYIKKTRPESPLAKEGMGMTFVRSSVGEYIVEKYKDEKYSSGVYLPLLMAISFVETEYATVLSDEEKNKYNPFNATENGKANGKLIAYSDWKSGVEDQGRYLIDMYFKSDNTDCIEEHKRQNYAFIGCVRKEDSNWASKVAQEVSFIENYGVFRKLVYTEAKPDFETGSCATKEEDIKLAPGTISFPSVQRVVREAHLVTTKDTKWPKSSTDGLQDHKDRTNIYLESIGLKNMEATGDSWAPKEAGNQFGQGSSKELPTVEQETWYMNMNWQGNIPPAGEKWLICNQERTKCLVSAAGFETGPNKEHGVLGMSAEAHHYLGTIHKDSVYIGRLKDQSLNYGPILCDISCSSSRECAQKILDLESKGEITLIGSSTSDGKCIEQDKINVKQTITDISRGQETWTYDSHKSPTCYKIDVHLNILRSIIRSADNYKLKVTAILNGEHMKNSYHYKGRAVDFGAINGIENYDGTGGAWDEFMKLVESFGFKGTDIFSEGDHIHMELEY